MTGPDLVALYEGARDLNADAFGELAFGLLGRTLPFHSGMFGQASCDAAARLAIYTVHRYRTPSERLRERAGLGHADPAVLNGLAHAGQVVHTASGPAASADPAFAGYIRRYDAWQSLALIPAAPVGTPTDMITLWSGRPRRGTVIREVLGRAGEILPHVLLANGINRRLRTGEAGPARAVVALDGVLLSASPEALALLAAQWDDWTPPRLPSALRAALLAHGRYDDGPFAARAMPNGGVLVVSMTHRVAAPVLSGAERRVALLAAEGATYKEIARRCGVSPATVRNQLHAAYAKLDVRNKAALNGALARQA